MTYFPVVLGKATALMRAERLNWVADPDVIEISRFNVPEETSRSEYSYSPPCRGRKKIWFRPFNVLAAEFERMFSADPGYRVVVLERLFAVSLLICRPKGNSEQVKVKDREIELGLIIAAD